MKNCSDYGNGPPVGNENKYDHQPPTPIGCTDPSPHQNHINTSDFQRIQIKSEPHSPNRYPQHFYPDGFHNWSNSQYSFMPYSQENNLNKSNILNSSYRHHPYDRPNSQQSQTSTCNSVYLQNSTPSPSPKQCEKCGFICDSINQLTEHVNSCHPPTPLGNVTNFQSYNMLSGGEVIKAQPQSEILDLDSYKVHQVLPEEEMSHHQPHQSMLQAQMIEHQWNQPSGNQTIQPDVFNSTQQRMYVQQQEMTNVGDQRIFSPNYQNFIPTEENVANQQDYAQESINMDEKPTVLTDESPSPAKGTKWKSNDSRKPKTYNCTACNKWFTSSGHLKRHYNTTLHKNAVKTSGQPDPANLPISAHYRPKGEQSLAIDKELFQQNTVKEPDRPRSSNEQYDLHLSTTANQTGSYENVVVPPNVQADPSAMESRGLLSITNPPIPINPATSTTFNNTISNGFLTPMLMPMEFAFHQMPPNPNAPHDSPIIIINDPTDIGNEDSKFTPLISSTDNSQPLPSFSQIQRFTQMPYYGDVGGETVAYPPYNLTSFDSPQGMSYHNEEDDDRTYTLVAPPDSTSTDGDLLPIASSNNNNLIIGNDESVISGIKYDMHCSSPETSSGPPDIENSSPQISSTSNIVKPQPLHKCFDCNKVFNKSCYLSQHNKTFHSGDKPFKCVRCGKRFSCEQQHLQHHAKHGGDKPHKCDQCPKQFNHKTDLRRHMCLHTGKKPFICDLCGKGFIRKDHMMKHCETHMKKPSRASVMNNTLHTRNH